MKALLLLGLALAFGGVAAYMVSSSMNQQVVSPDVTVIPETRPVVVATADLPIGTALDRTHLRIVDFPVETYPANSYQSIDQVFEGDIPVVMVGMHEREVILPQRLSIGVLRRGITARIPDGYRAIGIPVNDVRGVGGFVLPGDRVDVLHTTSVGRRDEKPVTRTLLEGITVLGVDQHSAQNQENPVVVKVVTLLADPEQAKALTLAQQVGHLTLSLRNAGDDGEDNSFTVALNDLWNYEPGDAPVSRSASVPQPGPRLIKLIRGLKIDEESVSRSETTTTSLVSN